jgi:chromosome segregation ATPase
MVMPNNDSTLQITRETVAEAARVLQARGERVSVRAVHHLIGGSFRDLTPLLRALYAEVPLEDEPLGRIAQAEGAYRAAQRDVDEAQAVLDQTFEQLRALHRQRPPTATNPHEVAATVEAQLNADAEIAQLTREVDTLRAMVASYQELARGIGADWRQLQRQLHDLQTMHLPSKRRALAEAQQYLAQAEADAASRLRLARAAVARAEHGVELTEDDLDALAGVTTQRSVHAD